MTGAVRIADPFSKNVQFLTSEPYLFHLPLQPGPRAHILSGMTKALDLDLEIENVTLVGRSPSQLTADVVRPLQVDDLALLAMPSNVEVPPLKRIGERHHALARLLSSGVTPGEAAAAVGLQLSRVSVLQGDPAFQELMEFYRDKVDAEFSNVFEQLAGMSKDALLEIRRRIEDDAESLKLGELKDLLQLALDRTGHGPTHKQETNVTIDLGKRLDAARQRALEARQQAIRDVTPPDE